MDLQKKVSSDYIKQTKESVFATWHALFFLWCLSVSNEVASAPRAAFRSKESNKRQESGISVIQAEAAIDISLDWSLYTNKAAWESKTAN